MKFGRDDYDRRIVDNDNKIPVDEPCFFLRGKDALAPALLLDWAKQLRLAGGDPNMARNAEDHAQLMLEWQREHGSRTPDMYAESPQRKQWKLELKTLLKSSSDLEFDKLQELVKKVYGSTSKLYIFTSHDVKKELGKMDLQDLTIEHLAIDDSDSYSNCKLALFINSKSEYKIIKSDL